MINLTGSSILLDVDNADKNIRDAIATVLTELEMRNGPAPESVLWRYKEFAFQWYFRPSSLKNKIAFDKVFIDIIFDFAAAAVHEPTAPFMEKISRYTGCKPVPAHAMHYLKSGIKQLLVLLWSRKALLLPSIFAAGPFFKPILENNELYSFVKGFKPLGISVNSEKVEAAKTPPHQIHKYMTRVLWAADWSSVEDVSIYELANLHQAQRAYIANRHTHTITTSPVPWTLFLNELLAYFPGRVSYTKAQVVEYAEWSLGSHIEKYSFSEYEKSRNEIIQGRKIAKRQNRQNWNRQNWETKSTPRKSSSKKLIAFNLTGLAEDNSHEAALRYFKTLSYIRRDGINWLDSDPSYAGREHVKVSELAADWKNVFKAYLHQRKTIKGYEKDAPIHGALNIFSDYLFLYLPWWKEIYPNTSLTLPTSPKQFTRFAFVARSKPEPLSELPKTLSEIVKLRRHTPDSQRAAISIIEKFFSFVESHYAEDDHIAGPRFKNPISKAFDLPRVKKRTKTAKIPFEKKVYGYLLHYGYAVEAFGEMLQQKCFAGEFDANHKIVTNARWFDTEEFGFVPFVRHRGKIYPLKIVPNVFAWHGRMFRKSNARSEMVFAPHLTYLRLLVGAIEVGLRLMGLKWLDRRTWDKHNQGALDISQFTFVPPAAYAYPLHVSTDKTKDEAWDTTVVYRVRSLLLREQKFQLSIDEPDMDMAVAYDDRESRFGEIVPLFRSPTSPNCIGDYARYWLMLMAGFQDFYAGISEHYVQFITIGKMIPPGCKEPKVVVAKDGTRFSPLSVTTINTPHACRATFATNRQGLLELSDLAELLGHATDAVTAYYQKNRAADLGEKLEGSDKEMLGEFYMFDKDDAGFIRADKADSALVRAFNSDRETTIHLFGFMPSATLWCSDDAGNLDKEGLELLRNGPMSLIRFRETHICPVGEECPLDVIKAAGEPKRCGICPLAMKCIDHLPAISAKKHALDERIKYLTLQSNRLLEAGEKNAADAVWEEAELDANEYAGWKISEEVLSRIYKDKLNDQTEAGGEVFYHVDRPDIVRQHLQLVTRDTSVVEFFLTRIAESNAYPSMQSPNVQAIAARISNDLLGGVRNLDAFSVPGPNDVVVAANLLKILMKLNGLTIAEMAMQLADNTVKLSSAQALQLAGA